MGRAVSNQTPRVATVLFTAMMLAGCRKAAFLDQAKVQVAPDAQSIRVALVFGPQVKSTLSKLWEMPVHGSLFVLPYQTEQKPMELGFDLKLSVFDEPKYLGAIPTRELPNGLPIQLTHPLVAFKNSDAPQDPNIDLVGYVDVLHAQWLGVAADFHFASDEFFQAGLEHSAVFLMDDYSRPGLVAQFYGPVLNPDGSLKRNGGVAVFADIPLLMSDTNQELRTFYPVESSGQAL